MRPITNPRQSFNGELERYVGWTWKNIKCINTNGIPDLNYVWVGKISLAELGQSENHCNL